MPAQLSYPGVYIEELQSGVRTIAGVATSITAFIGRALRGPLNQPLRVQNFADFERAFGGLWVDGTLGYAVSQFFQNGGGDALIVRVAGAATAAKATVGGLFLIAASVGASGLKVEIANAASHATNPNRFKLTVKDATDAVVGTFDDLDLTLLPADPNYIATKLATPASSPIRLEAGKPLPASRPANTAAAVPLTGGSAVKKASAAVGGLSLLTASEGTWGNKLEAKIDLPTGGGDVFNLTINDTGAGVSEKFLNLSSDPNNARFVTKVLEQGSNLARVDPAGVLPSPKPAAGTQTFDGGLDGAPLTDGDIQGSQLNKSGIWALEKADLFNLLCIPPLTSGGDISLATRDAAAKYCKDRRALFVADPKPGWKSHATVLAELDSLMARSDYAALFFPMLLAPDPLREGQIGEFAPCGAVAGVMARTDSTRGVWKAPAGIEAALSGVSGLSVKLTDGENGQLNPLAVNCLRSFPVIGRVVWGARTLRGDDQSASQWKYIPVRRLALFLEESLYRGTQWVVFEPNDEPLWAQIRLNIGAFMQTLFRQGAFQGATPRDAYFVKCSSETTTQTDIDNGIVNIIVGFAPLKPAEFVVIKIQQIARQP